MVTRSVGCPWGKAGALGRRESAVSVMVVCGLRAVCLLLVHTCCSRNSYGSNSHAFVLYEYLMSAQRACVERRPRAPRVCHLVADVALHASALPALVASNELLVAEDGQILHDLPPILRLEQHY